MRKPLLLPALLAGLTTVSCSMILNNLPGVYKVDVQQGNIVDQSMVDQLRPGMTKRQVLYIMGSPMLKDVLRDNNWEYLYSNQPGGEDRQQKRITLFFKDDKIVGLQGDFKPSKLPVLKASPDATVDVPKRNLDESLWGSLTGWLNADDAAAETKESEPASQPDAAGGEQQTEPGSKGLWESVSGWFGAGEAEKDETVKDEADKKAEQGTAPQSAEEGAPAEVPAGEAPKEDSPQP